MARIVLAVQQIVDEGILPVYTAAPALVDGHSIEGTGNVFLHVKTGATPTNVTITTGGTLQGEPVADKVVVIGATSERLIGPFPPALYNQAGVVPPVVWVDFSAITTVTCAAFRP